MRVGITHVYFIVMTELTNDEDTQEFFNIFIRSNTEFLC